ncbi:MAG: lytic transglycosylase domain-containing protein [Thermodesulfobacteriota bacterium]|nr:lytic transglycosylase domain-containing protein [Thermodesulfobacteriota bacterium]
MVIRDHRCLVVLVVALVLFAAVPFLYADIYMYVDEDGTTCFTNLVPSTPKYQVIIKERKRFSRSYSTDRYDKHIREASRIHGVSFPLLKAIMKAESDFNPKAVSKKGAKGLMQIMPSNFRTLGIKDPFNPRESIMGGALYLRQMLDRFNGKVHLALAAYNAGPDNVDRSSGIPPIRETEDYVNKVMEFYRIFREG